MHLPHHLCKILLTDIWFLRQNHKFNKKLIKYFGHCHHHFLDLTHWMVLINELFLLPPKTKDTYWMTLIIIGPTFLSIQHWIKYLERSKKSSRIGQEQKSLITASAKLLTATTNVLLLEERLGTRFYLHPKS